MFYIYLFHFGIIIFVFYPTSNLINEETPAQCFPKLLTIFAKGPIVNSHWALNMLLYYLLAKVHRMSMKCSRKSFFCKTQL